MKSITIALVAILALITGTAFSNEAQAETPKQVCTDLVEQILEAKGSPKYQLVQSGSYSNITMCHALVYQDYNAYELEIKYNSTTEMYTARKFK